MLFSNLRPELLEPDKEILRLELINFTFMLILLLQSKMFTF